MTGPVNAEGVRPCLVVIRAFQSSFRRRKRTVLEFGLLDPALGCPAGGAGDVHLSGVNWGGPSV
jgi:hypothetical protein